jgi:hypothetical protein
MQRKTAVVLTSINSPNAPMKSLAEGAFSAGAQMLVLGDTKTPADFALDGCRYFSVEDQRATSLKFAQLCPERHYARKNIGYLLAALDGAEIIVETDDDNFPLPEFFAERKRKVDASVVSERGWVNVYRYFTEANIWPRGFPLRHVLDSVPPFDSLSNGHVDCPIQQGLANENPDVDAVYRLVLPLPLSFRTDRTLVLGEGCWCPFNSQNTTWWAEAFPLLYLPATCSFRMTDIWRSFVAQRIAWENGWRISFHAPTVRQVRNDHDLLLDFADEVPGYLHNEGIRKTLEDLNISGRPSSIMSDIRHCYEALVRLGVIASGELPLLDAWIADHERVGHGR